MIKKIVIFCITTMLTGFVSAQCNELFISEYVEGSRNNKALEIYNPTDKPVDLSQYRVTRWQNGSAAWTAQMSDALSGTLQPKDVAVLVLDRRDTTKTGQDTPVVLTLRLKADLFLSKDYNTSYSMSFNGDDAVSLDKLNTTTSKYVPVDIFGKIGERPSPAWSDKAPYTGTGTWYSMDKTLIRKDSVMTGVAKNPLEFNPTKEWELNPRDQFDSLGYHKCLCEKTASVKAVKIPQVVLFPNPTQNSNNGMVTAITDFVPVAVFCKNIQGANVSVPYSINSASSMVQTQLATADMAAGVYTLEFVSASGERVSARLIK
jgi:hypothetical protein